MAQGREPADELMSALRDAEIPWAAIGDARVIGRIGDAVHGAHAAVRTLVAEVGACVSTPGGRTSAQSRGSPDSLSTRTNANGQ